ncbi:PucR family transcriptional regulator [Aquisalibacillus elongatus]|uniref:PucR-like helix-turn-helix protein n=1 Tax=Aquisalibacillus elongatus TaxID=485577 RepID=A0A3N5BBM9_9BACI|nr:helix-turn-helix domain-containing protein [Aquisalibacillus elongatus]RPF54339.1 PucR-like helix-turn-helix protein [Aquisalibacillus elongatus]
MNLHKLSQLFPNIKRVQHAEDGHFIFQYKGQQYAIPENDIDAEQKNLILALSDDPVWHSEGEQRWLAFLNGDQPKPPETFNSYRIIIMQLKETVSDPTSFNETIQMIVSQHVTVIWLNPNEVILLEDIKYPNDTIDFDSIIDVMSEDLDTNIRLMISSPKTDIYDAPTDVQWLLNLARTLWPTTGKRILDEKSSLIPLLPSKFSDQDRDHFTKAILKTSLDDENLLNTIKTVIEHQGNVSSAAKTLYMHRNSVQYRVDKFLELTGNDIRQFDHMLRVYLAVLLID